MTAAQRVEWMLQEPAGSTRALIQFRYAGSRDAPPGHHCGPDTPVISLIPVTTLPRPIDLLMI